MNMKQHILIALREQIDRWEELLAGLSDDQFAAPLQPSDWRVQDVIAHLWGWQQRTIARAEAFMLNREPEFPKWAGGLDPNLEANTDIINEWIYTTHHDMPWAQVHQLWRDGYTRLLQLSEQVSERDLLDSGKYAWLNGYPLAGFLLATYDRHQEHYETVVSWTQEQGAKGGRT